MIAVARLLGAVYVTEKGVMFVRVPQNPAAVPSPAQPVPVSGCAEESQVTPLLLVSPPRVAVKLSVEKTGGTAPGWLASIDNVPVAETTLTVTPVILPPQPQIKIDPRQAKASAARRSPFIRPPGFPLSNLLPRAALPSIRTCSFEIVLSRFDF